MTLAPDHLAYHRPGEVDDAPVRVSVVPDRPWRHLAQPPEDAPDPDNLVLARDVVLAHLHDGAVNGDPWELTWAAITLDLNNPKAIPLTAAEDTVANYNHWVGINGGSFDWDPGDADELNTEITRHLTTAGYTEGN